MTTNKGGKVSEKRKPGRPKVQAIDRKPKPKIAKETPQTPQEVRQTEDFRAACHRAWDGHVKTVIDRALPEQSQIRTMLSAYIQKIFGGDAEYVIGFFTERDIEDRKMRGYKILNQAELRALTIDGKPGWSDAIARSMRLVNHADGTTIRWGLMGELILAFTRKDIWINEQLEEKALAQHQYNRAISVGKKQEEIDGQVADSDVEVKRQKLDKDSGWL
jgi:hypothetical protein